MLLNMCMAVKGKDKLSVYIALCSFPQIVSEVAVVARISGLGMPDYCKGKVLPVAHGS